MALTHLRPEQPKPCMRGPTCRWGTRWITKAMQSRPGRARYAGVLACRRAGRPTACPRSKQGPRWQNLPLPPGHAFECPVPDFDGFHAQSNLVVRHRPHMAGINPHRGHTGAEKSNRETQMQGIALASWRPLLSVSKGVQAPTELPPLKRRHLRRPVQPADLIGWR